MMFGNQFLISPGGQSMTPSKLSSHFFFKENPSFSLEHMEISDAVKILSHS